jgi:immune inhibitor A
MLVFLAALLSVACSGGSSSGTPSLEPTAGTTATAVPTPAAPPRSLAEQIGVRADLPVDDPIDLSVRYGRTATRAAVSKPFGGEPAVGSSRNFTVAKLSGGALQGNAPPVIVTVDATLEVTSAHAYFYEDSALDVDASAVQQAADKFESTVWPKVTSVFGEPLSPGVDGDPRIIVLQADLGGGAGGYYSSDDAYLKAVRPLSNEAEMVYIDRSLRVGGDAFNVVLAHEFQHLIHAHDDPNEEAWVNEGLSEDASGLVGGAVSSVNSFAARPQTQLNDWEGGSLPHYGASAAFFRYVASRFGGDPSLGVIAREPGNGEVGVDEFLKSQGTPLRFRDVFADWIVANILNGQSGPYGNPGWPVKPSITRDLVVDSPLSGDAHQFGADYFSVGGLGAGDFVLRFDGASHVDVLPTQPPTGGAVLWANAEDNIDTTLTRDVDLTTATEPVLTFKTWYDIEHWYDWGYVAASTDGGATWRALPGDGTSSEDPARSAYGPGYTGKSGGSDTPSWVDERVSLADYAGKKIKLRFEYVTDQSTHGVGWAIADIGIQGTAFQDSTLADPDWRSEGWVRIADQLPQTYTVRMIETMASGEVAVLDVPVDATGHGELRFNSGGVDSAVLAIAGTTEGTSQTAAYTVELQSALQ